jgi:hypothetical protein
MKLRQGRANEQNKIKRRPYAQHAPHVELLQADQATDRELMPEQTGDQETADEEENSNAKPARYDLSEP